MSNARNLANLLNSDTTITSADILDGTVATQDIADNAITTAKIPDGAITAAKINSGVTLGGAYFQGENGAVGATAGKGDIFRVHEKELNTNVTIAATDNALASGPLTVASGITLTITNGGRLAIV
ncbi:MAG: hypothetical protein CMB98_06890 [Flavobacteriaceae bacterium]|nr:hypothetical protein [Flavobacteriaceae bacterium]|tara:strand:- start:71 stop:445 length:375 start_codon:yes stop_codon:yes gene_type:complete